MNNLSPITIIIQARMGSTRLPKKMLLPFEEQKGVLEILIDKILHLKSEISIVLATTTNPADDKLALLAKQKNILVFRGDEEDVLKRFIDAAEKFSAQRIIRVCADNPFLDINSLLELIEFCKQSNHIFDYVGFRVNQLPSIKTHFGFWTEFVTLEALKKVYQSTDLNLYHEHVTNFIYENPNDFKIHWLLVDESVEGRTDIRMTLDTLEDFENLKNLYSELKSEYKQIPNIKTIVAFLDKKHHFLDCMIKEINSNIK
ncbi:glycosyltransferase family protein [Flavobacterium azooxidireducens]|uniref:Glycosyltransferase family protein n=1 Tax=Flavobacterium azooxidireducens TaxID=1871076 RepID=A0ABY4KEP8_9FLAO|nr:glycosyltransferase family protein [Flavobacterium azooxidireducens]UPQ79293.1 glycosyltransferase family protein [Flavobacterium azooxidireducens]